MNKIVVAMIDATGVRATGRYRDRHRQVAEIETFPEARACVWSDATDERLAQVKCHVAAEAKYHEWIGYFILPDTKDILQEARTRALGKQERNI